MRTLAILPVKSFDSAKQRLGALLAGGSRHALAQAMFSDVLASLCRARRVDAVAVVTGDRSAEAAALGKGIVVLPDDDPAGQSAAALIGIRHALAQGFGRALLVPGDTPLLEPQDVDLLLERTSAEGLEAAIVPDRHNEGTNALVLTPPDALAPSFGPGSLLRHLEAAERAGLRHRVERLESLAHDVDTPDDLADLATLVEARRGAAPRTRGTLRQLNRLRSAGPPPAQPTVGQAVEA